MIKLLAKLRQYGGGDIAEYLRTEHRQNLIALENALNVRQTTTETTTLIEVPTVQSGQDVFFANYEPNFSGTVPQCG
jgi:hypothetical protein